MTGALHSASMGRLLAIAPRSAIDEVLQAQTGRPIAALLTSHNPAKDPADLEPVVLSLLKKGCDYFVCSGIASEALHDRIDELVLGHAGGGDRTVMTTWHDQEPAAEVAEFFFNIAGARERCLLVAALESTDEDLGAALVKHAAD